MAIYPKSARRFLALSTAAAAALAPSLLTPAARANVFDWDPLQNQSAPGSGGGGSWNFSDFSWYDATVNNGVSDTPWANGNTAVFAANGGTVTLDASGINPAAVTFNVGGYTIANQGTNTNSLTISSGGAITTTGSSGTDTISAPVILNGNNTLSVASGTTLRLSNLNNSYGSGLTFNIASGGTLGLAVATNHTLPGNFSLNGNTLQLIPTATGTPGSFSTYYVDTNGTNTVAQLDFNAARKSGSPTSQTGQTNAATPTTGVNFLGNGTTTPFYTGGPAVNFALRVTAALNITTGGSYTFNTNTDDGSKLYVDNRLLVNNDGGHGGQTVTSPAVTLSAGLHEIRIDYEEGGGGYQLFANYSGPDTGNTAAIIGSVTPTGSTITGNIETLDPITNTNNVTVTNSGTINLSNSGASSTTSTFTQVGLGTVTLVGAAPTFNVTGSAGQSLHLGGVSLAAGVNNTVANTSVAGGSGNGPDVFLGPISGGGAGTTLTAGGTGQLFFDNTASANTGLTGATLVIPNGARVVAVGASAGAAGTNNPLGSAALSLSGGTLSLDTKDGGVTFANSVTLTGTATTSTIESQPSGVVMTLSGAVSLGANNLNVNTYASDAQINGAFLQINGAVTGTGNITKVASYQPGVGNSLGVLVFNGSNPGYSGTTTLAAGAGLTAPTANGAVGGGIQGNVATATDVPFGTGPLVSQGGTIYVRGSAAAAQTNYAVGNNVTLTGDTTFDLAQNSGGINDNVTFGTLTLGGTGTRALNFTSANGYNLTFGAATSTVPANINENNVSILTFSSTFALGGATNVALPDGGFVNFNGVVSGTGPFTVSSGGANGTGLVTLAAPNTYAGNTNVTNGTLKLAGGTNTLPVTTTVIMTGGTLDLNNTTQTVAGLSSAGGTAGTITNTATGTATLNVNGTNTYSAFLNDGGAGKVVALGVASGTTSLGGSANTYSGGSNVAAGATLSTAPNLAPGSVPFGTGAITLNSGSALKLTGVTTSAGGFTGTGLTASLYQDAVQPSTGTYASLAALNSFFAGLTNTSGNPLVVVPTTTGGKTNLDFSNSNYTGPNALFNTAPSGTGNTTAQYGFNGSTNVDTRFQGYIYIPAAGTYTFKTTSDDGSVLYIGSTLVVNNNAFQGATPKTGTFNFTSSGYYPITIGFYQGGGGWGLLPQISTDGTNFSTLTNSQLFLAAPSGPTQTFANAVNVVANANIDVTGSLSASLGALNLGAATLSVTSADTTASPYSLSFVASGTGSAGTLTGNGTINLAPSSGGGAATVTIGSPAGGNTFTTGTGPANSTLTVTGTGTLFFNAAASYTGLTTASTGVTLAGRGTLAGPATVASGATLSPSGNVVATATPTLIGGAFTVTGALTFTNNTSKFGVNLVGKATPGVTYDQVQFGGPVTLAGATLVLNDAAYAPTVTPGDKFWIMDGTASSSPVSGSLSYNGVALGNGATFTGPSGIPYTIFYNAAGDPNGTGRDVLLSAVPEPASLGLLGLGALGLLARRRRRAAR